MSYLLEVSDAANKEIEIAFFWYESEQENLGIRFLNCLDETINLITNFPFSYPIKIRDYHECYMGIFPFVISCQVKGRKVLIHSVFHTSQNPKKKK